MERALADAGLTGIEVTTREYTVDITPADYVAMKAGGLEGRLIRQMVGAAAWGKFRTAASELFQQRFDGSMSFVRDVHFGVATKHVRA